MKLNEITSIIIEKAIKVHKELGPGLLESAYKECLVYELLQSGLKIEKENPLPLVYHDVKLECGYRVDIVVEDKVIVEIKSIEALADIHTAQVLTHLKLANCKIGLLMNFNVSLLKDGIKRCINKYYKTL
jgi:GxxExxY protein